jgi:ASC-1-like (ASCH) protein
MQDVIKLICDDPWFTYIRSGLKPVEGRKNTPKNQTIHTGCLIEFSNGKEIFLASVLEIRSYSTLEAYLNDVTFPMALPGLSSFEEAVKVYHQWSTPDEIEKYGFLGIFVKPIHNKNGN